MTWGVFWRSTVLQPLKRAVCALAACALTIGFAASANAGEVATATGSSRATIVAPLTLVKIQDLDFGRIVARPTAGTVTVDQITGACSVTGAILEVGTCQYASFAGMAGGRNMNARISLDSVVSLTGPGTTMVLDNVKLGTNSTISFAGNTNANGQGVGLTQGNGNQRYTIATSSGIFVLNVGGRLNVNANQAAGTYTGSLTVTVQYQ